MASDEFSYARKRVQEAMERAEAEHKRLLQLKRMDLASQGLKAFHLGKPTEAATKLQTYLRIVEDWKGVPEGGLNPSLFDLKRDAAELLLISGVLWILVRLYDTTRSDPRRQDFVHYLEKYIVFSKGMTYQRLCAETLRKYIAVGKPRHKEELKNAYKVLAVSKCFIATELVDVTDVDTLPRLRVFRDRVLRRSKSGRAFTAWYYRNGPWMARVMAHMPHLVRRTVGIVLDRIAKGR